MLRNLFRLLQKKLNSKVWQLPYGQGIQTHLENKECNQGIFDQDNNELFQQYPINVFYP